MLMPKVGSQNFASGSGIAYPNRGAAPGYQHARDRPDQRRIKPGADMSDVAEFAIDELA
jgi:hypothetical protein